MAEHTPTPWGFMLADGGSLILGPGNQHVATVNPYYDERARNETNAAFIVRAVNSHDELKKILRGLANAYKLLPEASILPGSWHSHAVSILAELAEDVK